MAKYLIKKALLWALVSFLLTLVVLPGCSSADVTEKASSTATSEESSSVADATVIDLESIPEYSGDAYVEINGNAPEFTEEDYEAEEFYSELDELGRCGVVFAIVGTETMPTEERESIGAIKPTGWHTVRYDDLIEDKYLYNRCHLIGYQLTGQNANERNLITGTRYLNIEGMLPFENLVADYVESTGNHVLYRVTPIFSGDELVARGVQIEALSVEDNGEGIAFNVYCYNVQPGIEIDYATGDSWRADEATEETTDEAEAEESSYVCNTNTMKFHRIGCSAIESMSEKNREDIVCTRDELIEQGYEPCGLCNP